MRYEADTGQQDVKLTTRWLVSLEVHCDVSAYVHTYHYPENTQVILLC